MTVTQGISFLLLFLLTHGAVESFSPSPCRNAFVSILYRSRTTIRYNKGRKSIGYFTGNHPITSQLHLSHQTTQPSSQLADDDLVALPFDSYIIDAAASTKETDDAATTNAGNSNPMELRLCVIRNQEFIYPLIRHEDDVETDLFLDPRYLDREIPLSDMVNYIMMSASNAPSANKDATTTTNESSSSPELPYYGVGWYGQRPVPSLGGGPGYGAEADEVWSIEEEMLETLMEEEVEIPVIDVGIAHGEKARGGALF